MKKFFEEPVVECMKITSEVITDEESHVPDVEFGTTSNIFPDIK